MVMPVPESGIPAAEGFARRSGIPFGHALVKNRYIGRTFIAPSQEMRALGVRMKQHVASAKILVDGLSSNEQVERVFYPGLTSHKGHEIAARQMKAPGGMISFELAGGLGAAKAFLESLRVFVCAESLGGVESLAEHPAIMTHASVPADARAALGIGDGLIRLSVGLEDVDDLAEDLDRGFSAAAQA